MWNREASKLKLFRFSLCFWIFLLESNQNSQGILLYFDSILHKYNYKKFRFFTKTVVFPSPSYDRSFHMVLLLLTAKYIASPSFTAEFFSLTLPLGDIALSLRWTFKSAFPLELLAWVNWLTFNMLVNSHYGQLPKVYGLEQTLFRFSCRVKLFFFSRKNVQWGDRESPALYFPKAC